MNIKPSAGKMILEELVDSGEQTTKSGLFYYTADNYPVQYLKRGKVLESSHIHFGPGNIVHYYAEDARKMKVGGTEYSILDGSDVYASEVKD